MDITQAFSDLQSEVNVRDRADKKARGRRDVFKDAFAAETTEIFASGSLARGSQIDPINDVDMVAVFSEADYPHWGADGDNAEEALEEVRLRVRALLGQTEGVHAKVVRQVNIRNHSVKCFLDDPEVQGAFTVDLVPALARNGHLLIPEQRSKKWVESDPKLLMSKVAAAHADWNRLGLLHQWVTSDLWCPARGT
nr:nucleotidyltransferase [Patulibacter sp.]